METFLVIRGRAITGDDLIFIRSLVEEHQGRGRTFVSKELCRLWDWRQRNGMFKTMACSELLLRLEKAGLVQLPPIQHRGRTGRRRPIHVPFHSREPIRTSLQELGAIDFKMVRGSHWEPFYKGLIQAYHYLGYCQTVGEHLKYMVFHQGRPLACLGWGAAAWNVASRDRFIGWQPAHRDRNLHLIAQNTRLLILPWIQVPYLASHILGSVARILSRDWEKVYHHPILLLETFVDGQRFKGTCYRAANWIHVGFTQGRGKWDSDPPFCAPIKAVWLYPLAKNFREVLTHLN